MTDQADEDASAAVCYAQGMLDASREHVETLTSLLLLDLAASSARLGAARERMQQRRQSAAAGPWDGDAGKLLERALARLEAAAVSTPEQEQVFCADLHQQHYPDAEPFTWDQNRRNKLSWWLRRLLATGVRISHQPRTPGLPMIRVTVRIGRRQIGRLKYFPCDQCRFVLIGKLDINREYQGLGIGGRTIETVFRRYPGYEWYTTAQYDTSGTFWPNMARRTGASFTSRERCPHMK